MRDSEDFSITVRRGSKAGRTRVVVHVLRDEFRPVRPQVGFVVSRAVGSAVVRNRVKRRLRHAMNPHVARLSTGTRVVVRALPPAAEAEFVDLSHDLESALDRAGAW